jgi:hypothetical protein
MGKYGTTRTLNENTGRMVSVDAPRHTFADGENGVLHYDAVNNSVVLHGNERDYIPSGKHFKTKAEVRHAATRSGVIGSVVDVNHKDPFKGGYEIYHPMVVAKPRDLIAQPSFFAATKRAVPSGANVLAVKPVRMGRVHRARGGLTRRK